MKRGKASGLYLQKRRRMLCGALIIEKVIMNKL